MSLADAPAVEDDAVSSAIVGVLGVAYDAGDVDARHHGELAHHRTFAGDRKPILVVQRRVGDLDGDVALGQLRLINVAQGGTIPGLILLDQDRLEHAVHSENGAQRARQVRKWLAKRSRGAGLRSSLARRTAPSHPIQKKAESAAQS